MEEEVITIILFTVGFSLVFIIFGAASTFIGQVLLKNSYELRVAAGLIIIVLSLHILGVINLKFLKLKIILVSILIIVALISVPIISLPGDNFYGINLKYLKHALEWDYFIGVSLFYLLTFLFWKKESS